MNSKSLLIILLCLPIVFCFGEDTAFATRMLIITPLEFRDALQPFINYKFLTGIDTVILTLESIHDFFDPGGAGTATPEQIKQTIDSYYNSMGIDYVLLVGDINKFPVRWQLGHLVDSQVGHDRVFLPSDYYYADLYDSTGAFNDWDTDGDGYYGEIYETNLNLDGMDFTPDVAVARIPAADIHQLETYIVKVIRYEFNKNDTDWFYNILLIQKEWSDCIDSKETIAAHLDDYGFDVKRLYADINAADYSGWIDGQPTTANINLWLNSGVGFVSHLYHSFPDRWDTMYTLTNIQNDLTNKDKLPVIYSGGCQSTQFFNQTVPYCDYDDVSGTRQFAQAVGSLVGIPAEPASIQPDALNNMCIAEAFLLENEFGAIAYYGSMETGEPNQWDYAHSYLEQSFFTSFTPGNNILGDMWRQAIISFATANDIDSLGQNGWQSTCTVHTPSRFILFGDPSLRVGGVPDLRDTAAPTTIDDTDGNWHNEDVIVTLIPFDHGSPPLNIASGAADTIYTVDGVSESHGNHVLIPAPADHSNDGIHMIGYLSSDFCGNGIGGVANVAQVKIDTAKPVTQIHLEGTTVASEICLTNPDGGLDCQDVEFYDESVTVTLNASDDSSFTADVSGPKDTAYNYGRWPFEAYGGPFNINGFCGNRIFTLEYFSTDAAGNREDMKTARIAITSENCLSDMGIIGRNARILAALKEIVAIRMQQDYVSTLPPIKWIRYDYSASGSGDWVTIGTDLDAQDGWGVEWDTTPLMNGNYQIRLTVFGSPPGFLSQSKTNTAKNSNLEFADDDPVIYREIKKVQVSNFSAGSYMFELGASPREVNAAEMIEFTLTFKNSTGEELKNLNMTCDLDIDFYSGINVNDNGAPDEFGRPSWNRSTLPDGESWVVHFIAMTKNDIAPGTILSSQAFISADTIPMLISDDPATAEEEDYTTVKITDLTATIWGMVRHYKYNTPLSATVSITGPVSSSLKTDYMGRYYFSQLPPGTYLVKVSANGYEYYQPSSPVSVKLDNQGANRRVDFFLQNTDASAPQSQIDQTADEIIGNNLALISGKADDPMPGSGVKKVDVSIRRSGDGYYWNGNGWVAGQTVNTASGTGQWQYDISAIAWDPSLSYTFAYRAEDHAGNIEQFHQIATTPDPPNLISPPDKSATANQMPAFDWSDVADGMYILEVDNNSDFLSPEIHRPDFILTSSFTPTDALAPGTYYWRVKATGYTFEQTQWSQTWQLTITAPALKGDINQDGAVGLDDAILGLLIMTGATPASTISTAADVDGDGKIGSADVIFILESVVRIR